MAQTFLQDAGTNGFIATPFNLLSTELNALTNGSSATSSVGGSSGVFSQSNIANAIKGMIYAEVGGAFTPTAGAALYGWFLRSPDGGTSFEKTTTSSTTIAPLPRAPDFVIPLDAVAYASSDIAISQDDDDTLLAAPSWKLVVWNLAGATLPATGNTISVGPTATQAV